jgi:hypothetical protein
LPNCRNYKKEACVSYREIRKIIAMSLQLLRAPHNIPRTLMAGLRHPYVKPTTKIIKNSNCKHISLCLQLLFIPSWK